MNKESVIVPRELFEWLVEYALDLRGEWRWKLNSTLGNNQEMAQMDEHIFKALQIREAKLISDPSSLEQPAQPASPAVLPTH